MIEFSECIVCLPVSVGLFGLLLLLLFHFSIRMHLSINPVPDFTRKHFSQIIQRINHTQYQIEPAQ